MVSLITSWEFSFNYFRDFDLHRWYNTYIMTVIQLVNKDNSLIKAFRRYSKRYLSVGKKPDVKKSLPEDLYSTMRLEGEKVTKKAIRALFR